MSTLDIGLDDELGTPRMATDGGGPNRNGNRRRGGGAKRKKTAPVRILGAEEQEDGRGLGASEDESEFVLLIPDEFMGSILGRGGSTIRRLQWQTHTTIKCSNSDDLYPGTTSRKVTLVSSR